MDMDCFEIKYDKWGIIIINLSENFFDINLYTREV